MEPKTYDSGYNGIDNDIDPVEGFDKFSDKSNSFQPAPRRKKGTIEDEADVSVPVDLPMGKFSENSIQTQAPGPGQQAPQVNMGCNFPDKFSDHTIQSNYGGKT